MSDAPDPLAGRRPIHTRNLDVEVRASGPGAWQVRGELVDLRKAGFFPIAADLQSAGLLHHMRVAARFDPGRRALADVAAEQPAVAFEPSALTEGDSCRGPIARIGALAGSSLDADWDARLQGAIGGPRGCSHVLTLARLVGATLAWLVDHPTRPAAAAWRAGERIFHRALCYDGGESGSDTIALDFQLTDLHLAPAPERVRPLARLGHQTEVRGRALVARGDLGLRELRTGLRGRGPEALESASWRDAPAALRDLEGQSLRRGLRRRALEALPGEAPGAPLVAALGDLSGAALQCLGSDCDPWLPRAVDDPSLVLASGLPDSCWMWRSDGPLARARERDEKARE